MARLWMGGGEFSTTEMQPTSSNIQLSTEQRTGVGSERSIKISKTVNNSAYWFSTYPATVSQTPTSGADIIFYKSDIYIGSLPNNSSYKFQPLCIWPDSTLYPIAISIWKNAGVLYLGINNYNNALSLVNVSVGVGEGEWFRLEAELNITGNNSNPGRKAVVKINGVEVINEDLPALSIGSGGGIGPRIENKTGASVNASDSVIYMDNIAINNQYGDYNNSWVGEEVVVYLPPSGPGDSNATAGTYASINEKPYVYHAPGNPATSISLSDATTEAWYTVVDPTTVFSRNSIIKSIYIPIQIAEAVASNTAYQLAIKSQPFGTVVNTPSYDAGNTTIRMNPNGLTAFGAMLISDTDPTTTLPWKVTGVNSVANAQIGVLNRSANGIWVVAMGMMLGYIPGAPSSTDTSGMMMMF